MPGRGLEFQDVPVRVGNQDVLSLATHPAAHIDVTISRPRTIGIGVEADPGLALFAVSAPAACDIERDRDDIADGDEFHVRPHFDNLTCDLVAENQVDWGGDATPHDMLIGPTDVGGNSLENDAVGNFAPHVLLG